MSLFKDALKQRKEDRKKEEKLRVAAMQKARLSMTAEARLSALLDNIAKLFEDSTVKELTFEIEEASLSVVSAALYEGKFAEYEATLNGKILTVSQQIVEL